eukprot:scaffold11432_cov94-Amphora_coffeaeformis.AAC.1
MRKYKPLIPHAKVTRVNDMRLCQGRLDMRMCQGRLDTRLVPWNREAADPVDPIQSEMSYGETQAGINSKIRQKIWYCRA